MRILEMGPRNVTLLIQGPEVITMAALASDGVVPSYVSFMAVDYDVGTGPVTVAFDATAPDVALSLTGRDSKCFKKFGGIVDSKGAGTTGSLNVVGAGTYTIVLTLKKHY